MSRTRQDRVQFRDFLAGDVVQLALQPSQHVTLGILRPVLSYQDGEELAAGGPAWTAIAGDRIAACFGLRMLWPATDGFGGHAVAWALIGHGIGAAHLAFTRYVAARLAESPVSRIEAIVRADAPAEPCWARLVGFRRRTLLRRWGPEGAPHILFERLS